MQEGFREEDKGRLTKEAAKREATALKDIAVFIVNSGINKTIHDAHKYDKLEHFQDFSDYWDGLVKKYLGTIRKDVLIGQFEDLDELKGLKGKFFNFLSKNLIPLNFSNIRFGTELSPVFYDENELISKETYEQANEILSSKKNVFKLIRLMIEAYFKNKNYLNLTRHMGVKRMFLRKLGLK